MRSHISLFFTISIFLTNFDQHYEHVLVKLDMASSQIVVVGAGPAGIAAARELHSLGFKNVLVLEAAARVGGRVVNSGELDDPQIREISRGTVELGPSFIHGDCENEFLEYLKANGARIKPGIKTKSLAWPNYFYLGKEAKLLSGEEAEKDADLQRMLEVYEMLDGLDAKLIPEETLLQYFVRMGVPSRVLDLADAIFANDYGADMSTVGLKETVQEQHAWKYGEDYLILEGCTYSDVFHDMARASPAHFIITVQPVIHAPVPSPVSMSFPNKFSHPPAVRARRRAPAWPRL